MDRWEPLPAALARAVTGDDEFVERVRNDLKAPALKDARQLPESSFHVPHVLVRCLEFELRNAGYILSSPPDQLPHVAALAKPCGGRFQQLVADFERWLQQLPADYARFSSYTSFEDYLRKYLRGRFDVACAEICEGIANGRLEGKGVLVDGRKKEHPAALIPASSITKDMKIGDNGLLYQGEYKQSPAWKWVSVRARQPHLSSAGAPLDGFCPAPAEVKSKPGPDGFGAALQEAHKAIRGQRPGEQKQAYRKRLAGWIKDNGGTPPSDDKTFRKYGY